ncbi:MAG: subtilisin-like proprotein convertase family protein [Saprospiraceae bacterium]|jgi:subtilisin-like proprotein convertase family protein
MKALFSAPVSCDSSNNGNTAASTDVPKDIVIETGFSIISTLTITEDLVIGDLNVIELRGTHTYFADLTISLTGPNGTNVIFCNASDCDEDNFNLNLDDDSSTAITCPPNIETTFSPFAPLVALNNKSALGDWILTIEDC